MTASEKCPRPNPSLPRIFGYAAGEGVVSITMNGISTFAMLYCTLVLGLSAAHAGFALSISMFWDAITDPAMGHITDNTRTRFGRRHPYLVAGGFLTALFFTSLWLLPGASSDSTILFWLVLLITILVRTSITVYMVPFVALGFELCPNYESRSRLQGIRYFVNQGINFIFSSLALVLFFRDQKAADGTRIDGTTIAENYLHLGLTMGLVILILGTTCIFCTVRYAQDNRGQTVQGNSLAAFRDDLLAILRDRLAWYVFGFLLLAQLGMMLTSQTQMFTYVFFMELEAIEKTIVHGGGAIAFSLGALSLTRLVKLLDKKPVGFLAMALSASGGFFLLAFFSTGLVTPDARIVFLGFDLPYGVGLFAIGQWMWWGGCGVLVPLATSMVADLSELNYLRTGILKDGGYASVFSFFLKTAASLGLFLTGWIVTWAGIESQAEIQTPSAIRNIALLTFLCGPATILLSFLVLRNYPVTRSYMERARGEAEAHH